MSSRGRPSLEGGAGLIELPVELGGHVSVGAVLLGEVVGVEAPFEGADHTACPVGFCHLRRGQYRGVRQSCSLVLVLSTGPTRTSDGGQCRRGAGIEPSASLEPRLWEGTAITARRFRDSRAGVRTCTGAGCAGWSR